MTSKIHPTAIVEDGVTLGDGTQVWDCAHIRGSARLGRSCIVGGKSYIGSEVVIGDFVKINSFVYIPTGVTIGNGVMISAGTIFTNDPAPRATDPELQGLLSSDWQDSHKPITVEDGASFGAGCRIGPGVRIGRSAMVGMGAVVTKDVSAFHLVVGLPAHPTGAVCRCGTVLVRGPLDGKRDVACSSCERRYSIADTQVAEIAGPKG